MATTWDEIAVRLDWMLEEAGNPDPTSKKAEFPVVGRITAWNWAQDIFSTHTAAQKVVNLLVTGRSAEAPADLVDLSMIHDVTNGVFYSRAEFHYGGVRLTTSQSNSYWKWGNTLYFEKTLKPSDNLVLYYWAKWPRITYTVNDDSKIVITQPEISIPEWAELPLVHLTCATLMVPKAIQEAINADYKIRIDLPVGEPRAMQAREHLWWYHELMGKHAPQSRLGPITTVP